MMESPTNYYPDAYKDAPGHHCAYRCGLCPTKRYRYAEFWSTSMNDISWWHDHLRILINDSRVNATWSNCINNLKHGIKIFDTNPDQAKIILTAHLYECWDLSP